MATNKEYSYFIKGDKIAIVQKDYMLDDGLNYVYSDGAGLGIDTGNSLWKSPTESITGGIEIEYTYKPDYRVPNPITWDTNKFQLDGWTIVDGYLTLLKSPITGWNDGFATDGKVSANEYILIRNSSKWNGIHKVKEVQDPNTTTSTHGGIQTYTMPSGDHPKYDLAYETDSSVTWAATGDQITGVHTSDSQAFIDSSYVWISGGNDADPIDNVGLFSGILGLGVSNTWYFTEASRHEQTDKDLPGGTTTSVNFVDDASQPLHARGAFLDQNAYIVTDIDVLNDESDEVWVNNYLAKAVVYYVKAKLAEDTMDIEAKEYFMKEFRKIVEKNESAKIYGPRIVTSGINAIR
tara:strand:+ start:274 stop:1323 length:1050 start_codon:yes stop_codon:yes gene_type:complete